MSVNLSNTAYREIRDKIILGEYLPNNPLSENELAKKLNMSRTPVRDAISRLESEGLVFTLKNRGTFVKDFTYKEYFDMKDVINSLHNFVIDIVLERGASFEINKLKDQLGSQKKASNNNDYQNYTKQSIMFERTLLESANNQIMLQTFDSFIDRWMRMAIVNWKLTPHKKHFTSNKRNEEIYNAIDSKDYSRIKQIIKTYNIQGRQRYLLDGSI